MINGRPHSIFNANWFHLTSITSSRRRRVPIPSPTYRKCPVPSDGILPAKHIVYELNLSASAHKWPPLRSRCSSPARARARASSWTWRRRRRAAGAGRRRAAARCPRTAPPSRRASPTAARAPPSAALRRPPPVAPARVSILSVLVYRSIVSLKLKLEIVSVSITVVVWQFMIAIFFSIFFCDSDGFKRSLSGSSDPLALERQRPVGVNSVPPCIYMSFDGHVRSLLLLVR